MEGRRPARRCLTALTVAGLTAGTLPVLLAPSALASTATVVEVVAEGLNSPRGIAFAPDGTLYVAENGIGGEGPCVVVGDPAEPEPARLCYGDTGSITAVDTGDDHTQTRVVEGLPSLALEDSGDDGIGPSDVSVAPDGSLHVVTGLGDDPAAREADLGEEGLGFGRLLVADPATGAFEYLADIAAYEGAHDPVQGFDPETGEPAPPDSNPHSVLVHDGRTLVADAGGNTVLSVDDTGEVSLLAALQTTREAEAPPFLGAPPGTTIPYESVPTSLAHGPDGSVLLGELTGFPFPVGDALVYELDETATDPDEVATEFFGGFTTIADVAVRDDDVWVLQFTQQGFLADGPPAGALVRLRPDGSRQVLLEDEGLLFPGGVAVHPETGDIYLSDGGTLAGGGRVLRIDPSLAGDPQIQAACPPDDVAGTTFGDIATSVHEEAITCLTWWDLLQGVSQEAFAPGANISRAQAASVLARLVEASDRDLPAGKDAFTDDAGSTHEASINALAAAGVVKGITATTFAPGQAITRAQFAALLVRTYEFVTGASLAAGPDAFDDDEGSTHEQDINAAAAAGWVRGTGERTFEPLQPISREQAASSVARMLSTLVEDGHAQTPEPVTTN